MSVTITNTGITKTTLQAKILELQNAMRQIYGADVNLDSNTQNGQVIGILTLLLNDLEELIVNLPNTFNPDTAQGFALDNIANLTNIQRKQGTFTTQIIRITADRVITLQGLGLNYNNLEATAYGVRDASGNIFYLTNNETLAIGNNDLLFRASTYGQVITQTNTITQAIEIVEGVTAITNTQIQSSIGTDEESDIELRLRRESSFFINTYNIENAIFSALINQIESISDARIFVNRSNVVVNGVDPRQLWCIVEGGSNDEIAPIIDKYRAYNQLKGDVVVNYTRPALSIVKNGQTIIKPVEVVEIKFDRPTSEPIKLKFDVKPLRPNMSVPSLLIKQYIVANIKTTIGGSLDTATLTDIIQTAIAINGGGVVPLNLQISKDDGSNWFYFLQTTNFDNKFTLGIDDIDITELSF